MSKLLQLFGSRINNKLALLSIIPVAVVTVIITWRTIETSSQQIYEFQSKTALQVARNLATLSDFALYSGREDLLAPIAQSAAEINAIASIVFLTPERDSILSPRLPDSITMEMIRRGNYEGMADNFQIVEEPVYLVDLDLSDFPAGNEAEGNKTLVGRVVVISDSTDAAANTRETILVHLIISFGVLLGAMVLCYLLSRTVVSPIAAMTRTVGELEKGNYNARIEPSTNDELAILAHGINHLAKAVAEGRETLESRIDVATERLRNTLDDLQVKNAELDAAREEAENASTAKGEFLAHMSHELRTPITAIQGFVNLLTNSRLEPSQQRYCTIIQQASNQLLQLIDDILDITRLQSNAVELDYAPFNLAECVETPLSLMAPNAHDKGLELILDIAPTVPYALKGDCLRIRQVVYNLLSNATKFTPAGFVSLKVNAMPQGDDQINLILQVTDTGIGIPDKDKIKLFEAFSQADNSISRRFGGSGLGLSIVKRLVNLMGGTLQLESTAGKGSRFIIELPLDTAGDRYGPDEPLVASVLLYDQVPESRQALEHHLARYARTIDSCEDFNDLDIGVTDQLPDRIIYSAAVQSSSQQLIDELSRLRHAYDCPITVLTPATSKFRELDDRIVEQLQPVQFLDKPPLSAELEKVFRHSAGGEEPRRRLARDMDANILIVEDNEFTRILLATFFEDSQCHLVMATNGREAIEASEKQAFDMILMDVHMPEVNGFSALQSIRTGHGLNRDTPIIMLTADILQQEENALFDAGASDLLFKPFNEQKLLACIQKHFKRGLAGERQRGADGAKKSRQRQLFVDEISRLTKLARNALDGRDEPQLRDATHQLLGIAGVYQMNYLERAVRALHKAIKSGDGNKMYAAMETLLAEVSQLAREETTG